ncbi:MAG: ATP-binding cassette domain-containing protein [Bacteroidota bacterium]
MAAFSVHLQQVAKRYDRDWVIRDFSHHFHAGMCYGISGRNGSGKSTLLRMISGHLTPTRGKRTFRKGDQEMPPNAVYPLLSYVGPYLDVIEEFSLVEAIHFHFQFKPLLPNVEKAELPQVLGLERWQQKPIKTYSSGMKQRVLLGLAICSATPLLLLDEPTNTLDKTAQEWFQTLLAQHKADRLVVIATNVPDDLAQCQEIITL